MHTMHAWTRFLSCIRTHQAFVVCCCLNQRCFLLRYLCAHCSCSVERCVRGIVWMCLKGTQCVQAKQRLHSQGSMISVGTVLRAPFPVKLLALFSCFSFSSSQVSNTSSSFPFGFSTHLKEWVKINADVKQLTETAQAAMIHSRMLALQCP